jgi:hypothetical protein
MRIPAIKAPIAENKNQDGIGHRERRSESGRSHGFPINL